MPVATEQGVKETLQGFLRDLCAKLEVDGPAIRSLIASAQDDPEFLPSFRSRFVQPRVRVVADILQAAQQRGELSPDADTVTALDALHGAFWYRLLQGEPLDAPFAERLAGFILRGLTAPGA